MKTRLVVTALLLAAAATAAPPRVLPPFRLRDPRGTLHGRDELLARGGLVLVVTAPISAQEEAQRGWERALLSARPADAASRIVFVEDLEQSWFPVRARDGMRAGWDPAGVVLLLVDEDGRVRRALGVEEGRTVALAYDRSGALAYTAAGRPTAAAAGRLWAAALR